MDLCAFNQGRFFKAKHRSLQTGELSKTRAILK